MFSKWEIVRSAFFSNKYQSINMSVVAQPLLKRDRSNSAVKYFSAQDRDQHRLVIQNGYIYHSDGKKLFDSRNEEGTGIFATSALYVLGRDMSLYYAAKQFNTDHKIYHSSIFAGKPVLCAGMIEIHNGKLVKISNGSIHYNAPPTSALIKLIHFLKQQAISPDTYSIRFHQSKTMKFQEYETALKFIIEVPYDSTPLPNLTKQKYKR